MGNKKFIAGSIISAIVCMIHAGCAIGPEPTEPTLPPTTTQAPARDLPEGSGRPFSAPQATSSTAPSPAKAPAPAQAPEPAPQESNTFAQLPIGKYRFVAAFAFYKAEISGEKIEFDFIEREKQDSPELKRSVGLNSGLGFYSNLSHINSLEKTSETSGKFTLRDYYFNVGNGGYHYASSNVSTFERKNIRSFKDLGFTEDLEFEAMPKHADQIILTRYYSHDDLSVQIRVVLRRE